MSKKVTSRHLARINTTAHNILSILGPGDLTNKDVILILMSVIGRIDEQHSGMTEEIGRICTLASAEGCSAIEATLLTEETNESKKHH